MQCRGCNSQEKQRGNGREWKDRGKGVTITTHDIWAQEQLRILAALSSEFQILGNSTHTGDSITSTEQFERREEKTKSDQIRTEQNRTEQNRTEQNRTELSRTGQNTATRWR